MDRIQLIYKIFDLKGIGIVQTNKIVVSIAGLLETNNIRYDMFLEKLSTFLKKEQIEEFSRDNEKFANMLDKANKLNVKFLSIIDKDYPIDIKRLLSTNNLSSPLCSCTRNEERTLSIIFCRVPR